ncbi:hypothetical protein [Escherichia phage vB_EcoS_SCS92]|nr:hypothetical protein [Escherichia phage vB_EcoS_SCS92]
MGIKLNLRKVNTAWVNVFERAADSEDENRSIIKGKYSVTFIMQPDHPQIDALYDTVYAGVEQAIGAAAAEKWMKANYGVDHHADKCVIRDLAMRDNPIEDFEEGLYFRATTPSQPVIMTSAKGEKQTEPDFNIDGEQNEGEQVYSGCVANVSVELWCSQRLKNLCATILAIKYMGEGKAFGGSSVVASTDDLEDDEEDEAPRRERRRR